MTEAKGMGKTEQEVASIICHKSVGQSRELMCIGSCCMAWDWLYPRQGKELERVKTRDKGGKQLVARSDYRSPEWRHEYNEEDGCNYSVRYEQIKVGDCGLKSSMGPELSL